MNRKFFDTILFYILPLLLLITVAESPAAEQKKDNKSAEILSLSIRNQNSSSAGVAVNVKHRKNLKIKCYCRISYTIDTVTSTVLRKYTRTFEDSFDAKKQGVHTFFFHPGQDKQKKDDLIVIRKFDAWISY